MSCLSKLFKCPQVAFIYSVCSNKYEVYPFLITVLNVLCQAKFWGDIAPLLTDLFF